MDMQVITAQFICRDASEVYEVTAALDKLEQYDNHTVLNVESKGTVGLSIKLDGKKHEWTL